MNPLCCLDYLYRDAGNFKRYGEILLFGEATASANNSIRKTLCEGERFIAEQVGLPPLYFTNSDNEYEIEATDHVWHEFIQLRPASDSEVNQPIFADVTEITERFNRVRNWQESLSANWERTCLET